MSIPSVEEIGYIITRIVIADEKFAKNLLLSTYQAGDKLLPADIDKIKLG